MVPVRVREPYAVVVPYSKKYRVMSPPLTFGPVTPFNLALVARTCVASPVIAIGGTFVQYGLGGLVPFGQTIVALPGAAMSALAHPATRPPRTTSHLRRVNLVI